ncbi:orotidine 5'-phosphate decarboxylase / HUMPS family protein [Paramicrobacterium chengjingii]|uniref:orotidine 5'-phosphate decarboxylase / HUMPS family protein n=1 Tax=Paramicrobacterium chengjingii TaxID=2769067 RepID=UPI00141F8134|nr:orotidine 5'-phosphate decarboxylase / HUMPS family protein [Microbacterium chengjingii]
MAPPKVQIAIDTTSAEHARELIEIAQASGADWIEIGKPLIEFEGLRGLEELKDQLEAPYVLFDLMVMSSPSKYISAAHRLGANNVTVSAHAPLETIQEAVYAAHDLSIALTVDLFNVENPVERAVEAAHAGADYVMVHFGVDQKRHQPEGSPIGVLREVALAVDIPVSYATYDADESRRAVEAGASVIVQGEPLLSAEEPRKALSEFIATTKNVIKGNEKS